MKPAHVLAKFAQSPQTESVYCLIRQKEDDLDAMSRVIQSLQARKISLNAAAMQKVTALHSSPFKGLFGLDPALFTTLKGKINLIIHAAWPVNFNLPLDSFESQMRGLATLIQFSLDVQQQGQSQPAKLLFCSSISVASRAPASDPGVPEELIPDFRYASRTGYARSKLVSEYIIGNAVSEYGADCHILRIGQIVGDSSAPVVQALPALDETCAWIPVDILAEIILELSFTQENQTQLEEEQGPQPQPQPALIYNLVNPRAFHWTRDLLPALKNAGLEFDALPPGDWVVALEHSSNSDPTRCPAMKLLSYFQYRYGVQHESAGIIIPPTFNTTNAQKYAPTLGTVPDLIQLGIIRRFVQAWNITEARGGQV
ncbi:male sterility protein-domain-containing protein [Aspergillus falconensis]